MGLIVSDSAYTRLAISDAAYTRLAITDHVYTRLVVADVMFLGASTVSGTASVVGVGSVTATGSTILAGDGSFIGILATTATGTTVLNAGGSVIGTAELSATGTLLVTVNATASLSAIGITTATGTSYINADGATIAFGETTAAGTAQIHGTGSTAAFALLTSDGTAVINYDGSTIAVTAVSAVATTYVNATGATIATGDLSAIASTVVNATGSVAGLALATAVGSVSVASVTRYAPRLARWAQKPPTATLVDMGHPLARNAAAIYNFAEGGGAHAQNAVIGAPRLTLTTPKWNAHGLAPDGVDGSGIAAANPLLDNWLTLGITAFIRFRNLGNNDSKRIFSLGASNEELTIYGNDTPGAFSVVNLGGAGFAYTASAVSANKTHEIALVVVPRASDRLLRVFIDGVVVSETAQAASFTPTTTLHIGKYAGGGFVLIGTIESVHVVRAALPSDAVRAHWMAPYDMMMPRRQ